MLLQSSHLKKHSNSTGKRRNKSFIYPMFYVLCVLMFMLIVIQKISALKQTEEYLSPKVFKVETAVKHQSKNSTHASSLPCGIMHFLQ